MRLCLFDAEQAFVGLIWTVRRLRRQRVPYEMRQGDKTRPGPLRIEASGSVLECAPPEKFRTAATRQRTTQGGSLSRKTVNADRESDILPSLIFSCIM